MRSDCISSDCIIAYLFTILLSFCLPLGVRGLLWLLIVQTMLMLRTAEALTVVEWYFHHIFVTIFPMTSQGSLHYYLSWNLKHS